MLYINADDFGQNRLADQKVISLIKAGCLNSVSLMANGENIDQAVSYLRSTDKKISVGIHFTLIDARPLADPAEIASLLDGETFLKDYKGFIKRYLLGRINIPDIQRELERQIIFLKDKKIKLGHADSHQHLHMLPRIAEVIVKLCKKYEIPRVRIVDEPFSLLSPGRIIPLSFFKSFAEKIKKKMRTEKLSYYEFYGFNDSMRLRQSTVKRAFAAAQDKHVELMCHPIADEHVLTMTSL